MKGFLEIKEDAWLDSLPEREGTYLYKSCTGLSIIRVVYYPSNFNYGIEWDGYFGVSTFRGKHVSRISGKFIEIKTEESNYDN